MSNKPKSLLGVEKAKQERKNLQNFINQIENNKEAYQLFYEMAEKNKLTAPQP